MDWVIKLSTLPTLGFMYRIKVALESSFNINLTDFIQPGLRDSAFTIAWNVIYININTV